MREMALERDYVYHLTWVYEHRVRAAVIIVIYTGAMLSAPNAINVKYTDAVFSISTIGDIIRSNR